jgi:hypothetical protein
MFVNNRTGRIMTMEPGISPPKATKVGGVAVEPMLDIDSSIRANSHIAPDSMKQIHQRLHSVCTQSGLQSVNLTLSPHGCWTQTPSVTADRLSPQQLTSSATNAESARMFGLAMLSASNSVMNQTPASSAFATSVRRANVNPIHGPTSRSPSRQSPPRAAAHHAHAHGDLPHDNAIPQSPPRVVVLDSVLHLHNQVSVFFRQHSITDAESFVVIHAHSRSLRLARVKPCCSSCCFFCCSSCCC